MNTEKEAAFRQHLEGHAATADDNSSIVITVTPDRRPGRYRAFIGAEQELLCVSRQPLLDGARKLLARGHYPWTILVMRWEGATEWALRSPLGAAANLTVDEHNGTLAKWRPLPRSTVSPEIAKSVGQVPEARVSEKAAPVSTAEKRRPTLSVANELQRGSADVQ
jgi:hypothetical protein